MESVPTILIVDDDAPVRALLADLLDDAGYRVLTAADGVTGLACAHIQHPDLILTDVMMPHIDGVQLCHALAVDPQTTDTPIILMSAAHREVVLGDCPGARFLAKPFQQTVLLDLIASIVLRYRTLDDAC
jgi:CheY-like chemotaxis protein